MIVNKIVACVAALLVHLGSPSRVRELTEGII